MAESIRLSVGVKTHVGFKRSNNEDTLLVVDCKTAPHEVERWGAIFAVADGLGGHAAGETASRMACEELKKFYYGDPTDTEASSREYRIDRLAQAIHSANRVVFRYARDHRGFSGMGTTLSVLAAYGSDAMIAHVGDSRIYRLRNDRLTLLTKDHTFVQNLVDSGTLSPAEAVEHPMKNILSQAVGTQEKLERVFTARSEIRANDRFLLCSDGLYDMVRVEEIHRILIENQAPQAACDALTNTALKNGGIDNVTAIILQAVAD